MRALWYRHWLGLRTPVVLGGVLVVLTAAVVLFAVTMAAASQREV